MAGGGDWRSDEAARRAATRHIFLVARSVAASADVTPTVLSIFMPVLSNVEIKTAKFVQSTRGTVYTNENNFQLSSLPCKNVVSNKFCHVRLLQGVFVITSMFLQMLLTRFSQASDVSRQVRR